MSELALPLAAHEVDRAVRKRLLVNHVYWRNVGHAIEGLRYSLGYHAANPDWEISLALNRYTSVELAHICPWIVNVYTIDVDDVDSVTSSSLNKQIPAAWDYVVADPRSAAPETSSETLFLYYQQMKEYLDVSHSCGYSGDNSIPYRPDQQLRLSVPESNVSCGRTRVIDTSVKVALLFAGHKKSKYFPSMPAWQTVLDGLYRCYESDLSIYLIGKLDRGDRRTASAVERGDVDELLVRYPRSVDCFDYGLLNQLAVVEACDLFVSPHSGFGFAALAVGTPWLTVAGGPFPEYFFNGVPFYSVLPDRERYPAYPGSSFETTVIEGDREVILSMSHQRIADDLPEIVWAARLLVDKRWSYQTCMRHHFEKLVRFYGGPGPIHSFDNVHEQWLGPALGDRHG